MVIVLQQIEHEQSPVRSFANRTMSVMSKLKNRNSANWIKGEAASLTFAVFFSALTFLGFYLLFLSDHWKVGVAVLVALIGLYQYSDNKQREIRVSEFSQYNELITTLIQGKDGCGTFVDLQVAVVFQLRDHYTSYYDLTKTILTNLDKSWSERQKQEDQKQGDQKVIFHPRLKKIIHNTIDHVNGDTEGTYSKGI